MSGLLVATMLTLLLIPVLYSLFDRKTYIVESDELDNDGFESQQANSASSNNVAEA
jgi:HAE1 family hydrophobic/amphiphilic exporter-1